MAFKSLFVWGVMGNCALCCMELSVLSWAARVCRYRDGIGSGMVWFCIRWKVPKGGTSDETEIPLLPIGIQPKIAKTGLVKCK